MGKIGKPQKSNKQKKIKAVDPFYKGDRKGVRGVGLNQTPKSFTQEIPRKLRTIGHIVDNAKKFGGLKKSKNKFMASGQENVKYSNTFTNKTPEEQKLSIARLKKKYDKEQKSKKVHKAVSDPNETEKEEREKKKKNKNKFKEDDIKEYLDTIQPSRPFVEPFQFKKGKNETQARFMKRVDREAHFAVNKCKLDEKYDDTDEKKIVKMVKARKSKERKKERLAEKKLFKSEAVKERKNDRLGDFSALKDKKVAFGEVVHAPPILKIRPKKVSNDQGVDKPGLRMPELRESIKRNMMEATNGQINGTPRQTGESVKRKDLSSRQQIMADTRRNEFINAYREMKKVKKTKIK